MKKEVYKKYVAQYKDIIYSQAYYFTGNSEDASDITQDVLIKFWHYFDKISNHAIKSWLLKVTKNLCIDRSRQKRELAASHVSPNSDDYEFQLEGYSSDILNPEQVTINSDLKNQLFRAIQKLPPKVKNVVIMREINDLKYEDIASSLGIPLNSVKGYLHRGRKLLFKYLKPYYQQG